MGICVVHLTTNFKIKYDTSLAYNIYTLLCAVKFRKMNLDGLKIIGNDVYKWCETGDWLLSGKIVNGIDGDYIDWYA